MLASWERGIVEVDTGGDLKIPAVDAHALIREALQRFQGDQRGAPNSPLTHDRQVETLGWRSTTRLVAGPTHRLRDGLQWGAEMPDFNSRKSPLAVAALT